MEKWGAPSTELQRVPEALIWFRTVRFPSGFGLLGANDALWNYDTSRGGRASPAGFTAIRRPSLFAGRKSPTRPGWRAVARAALIAFLLVK